MVRASIMSLRSQQKDGPPRTRISIGVAAVAAALLVVCLLCQPAQTGEAKKPGLPRGKLLERLADASFRAGEYEEAAGYYKELRSLKGVKDLR